MTATEERLRQLIAAHFGRPAAEIGGETRLRRDLNADSLDLLELALLIEAELDLTLDDGALHAARDVAAWQAAVLAAIGENRENEEG